MYILSFSQAFLAAHTESSTESMPFTLAQINPYMTQPIQVKLEPEAEKTHIVSWQLANQIQGSRKSLPGLKGLRIQKQYDETGATKPVRIDRFDRVAPGRVLLLTANFKRGLSDIILLQPILRAQAAKLKKMGWEGKLSISSSNEFRRLFHGQGFIDQFLPELPYLEDVRKYDYYMEYGISLDRMKALLSISNWDEIDLEIRLQLPKQAKDKWKEHFRSKSKKVFLHWDSFDKQRRLPVDWFKSIMTKFREVEFYCSVYNNPTHGEIFPGGPVNLWPYEQDKDDLFVILKHMDAVVTTNTGIAHVAAGLGRPTIVIFSGRLYGWDDFWPAHHQRLYPTMHPVGLAENLTLSPEEIQEKVIHKLKMQLEMFEPAAL